MWLNQGLECALGMGFNYSQLYDSHLDSESQERQQLILKDLCTSTTPFSETGCREAASFSVALLATVWAFNTSGVLLSCCFVVFTIRFRKNRIVKMSSPNLNVVTLLGSGLAYGSVYLFGIEKQTPLSRPSLEMLIQVRICMLYVSGSLALGPILGKSWRLYRVFTQKVPDKRVIIKDFQLLVMLSLLVLADIMMLFTWISLDPVQCLQNLSADVKVTDKGFSCLLRYGYVCKSLYSDFWLILLLGSKGILLMYGVYLAGLTDNLSCPPVNQSLTLLNAGAIIFVFIGILLVVNSFFHLWQNLVYGLTSGGILVCVSSINGLIFIPQIRQWKTFEARDVDARRMAKYFTGSNKNFHSTMYSDEEIYQLLGEKNTMAQQLAEKDAALASLQEQMTRVKETLMRLAAAEDDHGVAGSQFLSTSHLLPSHSTANFSSAAPENSPFPLSQEPEPGQNSQLPNSQYGAGLLSKARSVGAQGPADQEDVSSEVTAKCEPGNKPPLGAKQDEDRGFPQSSALLTRERLHGRSSSSAASKGARQAPFSAGKQKPSSEASSHQTFQDLLQDLSVNPIIITWPSSGGPKYNWERRRTLRPKTIPSTFSGSAASSIRWGASKPASSRRRMSRLREYPRSAPRSPQDGDSLPPPLPSLVLRDPLQRKPDPNWRDFQDQQEGLLARAVPGLPFLLDSGSSSSAEGTPGHRAQPWEVCRCRLSSSTDSCTIDTDPEYGVLEQAKPYGETEPTVNFKEDLEPTYV